MLESGTKMTVANGDFTSIEQKKKVMKRMVAALIHKGFNISSAADALEITRQTIHNYMNDDPEFRQMIESGLIEEVGQKAMMKLTHKALIEDSETAQKYLLDKTGYWDRRRDVNTAVNPSQSGDVIDVIMPSDIKGVADSLIGDFELDMVDPTEDALQKVLRASDPTLNKDENTRETKEEA